MMTTRILPTSFTKYSLTEKEIRLALLSFTELQIMYLQNILAESAEEKLALTVPANDIPSFLQQEAEIQGRIKIMQYILATREMYLTSELPTKQEE